MTQPGWDGGSPATPCSAADTAIAAVPGITTFARTRVEIGIRGGFPGALAEQLAVPATALLALPDSVDDAAGAMVEPGGNALRSVRAAALSAGDRALVLGTGTMGLLAAEFARADGVEVHLMGRSPDGLEFAQALGFAGVWRRADLPRLRWDAVIDASNAAELPALALDLVEPGKRVVYLGLSGSPSLVDTRTIALKDVTAVGILAASQGLAGTIEHYAAGSVDPRPLVAATVGLDRVGDVLAGWRPARRIWGTEAPHRPTPARRHHMEECTHMNDFDGLVAVITGGASGIGAATATHLLGRGARRGGA